MFANIEAIKTLVKADGSATKEEKNAVLTVIEGKCVKRTGRTEDMLNDSVVLSFADTAKILGYKNRCGVYAAIRHGRLRGYYGGKAGNRASGVLAESVRELLANGRRRSK